MAYLCQSGIPVQTIESQEPPRRPPPLAAAPIDPARSKLCAGPGKERSQEARAARRPLNPSQKHPERRKRKEKPLGAQEPGTLRERWRPGLGKGRTRPSFPLLFTEGTTAGARKGRECCGRRSIQRTFCSTGVWCGAGAVVDWPGGGLRGFLWERNATDRGGLEWKEQSWRVELNSQVSGGGSVHCSAWPWRRADEGWKDWKVKREEREGARVRAQSTFVAALPLYSLISHSLHPFD